MIDDTPSSYIQDQEAPKSNNTSLFEVVRRTIKQMGSKSPQGVKTDAVIDRLGGQYDAQEIRDAIHGLLNEGHVFCTTGEEYVKAHQ
jgi:hypothetical protein